MNLLLYEDLPLRTTRELGDFSDDKPLPHLFGDLTKRPFPLLRLSSTRFLAADHPTEVHNVYTDGQKTLSWEQSFESDDAGHTVTIVTLGAGVDTDVPVTATGLGKRSPKTGALLENPGDVCENVTNVIAGRSDNWQQLRDESSALGLKVAGRIGSVQSIRKQIDEITQSVGAIWSLGLSRIYPRTDVDGYVANLEASVVTLGRPSASLDDTADVLRLGYGVADASGKATGSIELTASPQRFGGVVRDVTYPWLNSAANAEAVGRRVLARLAGELYQVAYQSKTTIRPGVWCRLVDNPAWPFAGADPVAMPLAATINAETGRTDVSIAEVLRSVPTIKVTGHSVGLGDPDSAGVELGTIDGVTTCTVFDPNGHPLKGARVSIDGGAPQTTNDRGQCFFTVADGAHLLLIAATGYDPVELTVVTGENA